MGWRSDASPSHTGPMFLALPIPPVTGQYSAETECRVGRALQSEKKETRPQDIEPKATTTQSPTEILRRHAERNSVCYHPLHFRYLRL